MPAPDATTAALDRYLAHTSGCWECQRDEPFWDDEEMEMVFKVLCPEGLRLALAVFEDEVTE